ncbi:IPPc domain-containing protein [Aphelenchoides bicaudatus]|nr:IPPc domain-containing protein [Aphelenchoides bicaudatus]
MQVSDDQSQSMLYEQEHRFCTYANANIYCTTFNVNGRSPPSYLGNWLVFDTASLPDLVAIGLQEMDLALGTYVMETTNKQEEWLFCLNRAIPNVYTQVHCVRLIGIFLVLYRNTMSRLKISDVNTALVPTGFLKFGNKGGVAISLNVNDTSLCIVNSHLAAGNSELERRNRVLPKDFRDISQMQFLGLKGIYDHDVVIWIGDLNYRLSAPLSFEEVVQYCDTNRHATLFHYDQLQEQQKRRTAFWGFRERTPSFKPTYKYDVGTNNWDSSEKRRVPAWCDRILYWTRGKHVKIDQASYTCSNSVTVSFDCFQISFPTTSPVNSLFNLAVKTVDKKKRLMIYDELLKETDRMANNLLPQVSLSQTEVAFGEVEFDSALIASLVIKNTGQTSTRFHFSSQHQTKENVNISPTWLTETPNSSFIERGDEVVVTLQACVNNEEAIKIKERTNIACILILSLDQGRDYFIVVNATYVPPNLSTSGGSNSIANLTLNKPNDDNEDWLIDFGEASKTSAS